MTPALRQLPANYRAHSALDLRRKGWLRKFWSHSSYFIWLVCGILMFWIVVSLRPDARRGLTSLSWVDVVIILVVAPISLFVGILPLVRFHEGAYRVCFWLFTGERQRVTPLQEYAEGKTYIAPPDCYLTKRLLLIIASTPLIVWLLVSVVTLALVPIPVLYWIILPLALHSTLCVGDVIGMVWALQQPHGSLFNDQGLVTTAYAPMS
jgi:hypothetical protein